MYHELFDEALADYNAKKAEGQSSTAAAIAQGLGMVQGDGAGRFLPNRTATRLEAVVMLYQLMDR